MANIAGVNAGVRSCPRQQPFKRAISNGQSRIACTYAAFEECAQPFYLVCQPNTVRQIRLPFSLGFTLHLFLLSSFYHHVQHCHLTESLAEGAKITLIRNGDFVLADSSFSSNLDDYLFLLHNFFYL